MTSATFRKFPVIEHRELSESYTKNARLGKLFGLFIRRFATGSPPAFHSGGQAIPDDMVNFRKVSELEQRYLPKVTELYRAVRTSLPAIFLAGVLRVTNDSSGRPIELFRKCI